MSLGPILLSVIMFTLGYVVRYAYEEAEGGVEFRVQGDMSKEAARRAMKRLFPEHNTFCLMEAKGETLDEFSIPRCTVSVGDYVGQGDTWNDALLDLLQRTSN